MNTPNHTDDQRALEAATHAGARLDWLESEAIHILREAAAESRQPALLDS